MRDIQANDVPIWRKIRALRWFHLLILYAVTTVFVDLAAAPVFLSAMYEAARQPGHKPHLASIAFSPLQASVITAATLALSAILCLLYIWLSRWLERRKVSEFERELAGTRLFAGAAMGFVTLTLVIGIMAIFGDAAVTVNRQAAISVLSIVSVVCAPIFEELTLRGVWLRLVQEMYGSWVALISSAVIFGLGHAGIPGATLWSTISIGLSAGVLMGTAYIATRSLWLPIGLHFGWNFAEGDFWGTSDSGNAIPGLFHTITHGNEWVTGGAFGPEASIITPILSLVVGAYFYRLAVRRGLWVPFKVDHFSPLIRLQARTED